MLHRPERLASLYMENWSEMGGDRFRYGCVLEFQLAEGKGSICYDQSGYGNDGTIYGARWQKGPMVYALGFDGADDYVKVPDSPSVSVTGELTLEAFIKPVIGKDMGVISKDDPVERSYYMNVISTGRVRYLISPDGTAVRYHDSTVILTEVWHHIGAVFVPNTRMTIYIDGIKRGEITTNIPSGIYDGAQSLMVGLEERYNQYFDGDIALVRIYNRALSSEEVFALYSYLVSPTIKAPELGVG